MLPLLTRSQMAEVDRAATAQAGIPEIVLMEHAALALVQALENRFQKVLPTTRGLVVAGTGNNGGDVLAAARILHQRGITNIFVLLCGDPKRCSPSCTAQLKMLSGIGVVWGRDLTPELIEASDWILDGLLGTGLYKNVEGPTLKIIDAINRVAGRKWIISADLPSGLSSDTGGPLETAVHASETVTFGFIKRGLVTGKASDFVGNLSLAPIQIPRDLPIAVDTFLYTVDDAKRLPVRLPSSHKGSYGHVYIYLGRPETEGATFLSTIGALRSGAGLVTVVSPHVKDAQSRLLPEVMTESIPDRIFALKEGALVVGPGLGTSPEHAEIVKKAVTSELTLVLDADALTLLAAKKESFIPQLKKRTAPTIITPHPKEAARLLSSTVEDVERDRYIAAKELSKNYGVAVLLKGKGSVFASPGGPCIVINKGDTGLSRGGTGDLLTGILASFLAQGLKPELAAPMAAFIHGRASELLSQKYGTERATIVSEIAENLVSVFRELESHV